MIIKFIDYGKGFFKFSHSGNLIAVAGKTSSELFIYDSSDIHRLLDDIKDSKYTTSYKDSKFKTIRKICFSSDDSVLCLAFDKEIYLYDIKT